MNNYVKKQSKSMREKTLKITATAIFTALAYATKLFIKFKVAGF